MLAVDEDLDIFDWYQLALKSETIVSNGINRQEMEPVQEFFFLYEKEKCIDLRLIRFSKHMLCPVSRKEQTHYLE